jgi:hypothetical protein
MFLRFAMRVARNDDALCKYNRENRRQLSL